MYRLKRFNVIKETESGEKRDSLISQGYILVGEPKRQANRKGKQKEENDADDGGEPDPAG